jgi:hypothetical protein
LQVERFQAKWRPVRVKKTRQIKNLEPRFDSIETEKALVWNNGSVAENSLPAMDQKGPLTDAPAQELEIKSNVAMRRQSPQSA